MLIICPKPKDIETFADYVRRMSKQKEGITEMTKETLEKANRIVKEIERLEEVMDVIKNDGRTILVTAPVSSQQASISRFLSIVCAVRGVCEAEICRLHKELAAL